MSNRTCLVVSDGRRGIENQALGLAEALARRTALQLLPIHVPRTGSAPDPGPLQPEVWIGCGRAAVRAAAAHRRSWRDALFVYVQKPRAQIELFDLIVAPRHDRMRGPTVFPILGSPNRVTADQLQDGAEAFRDRLNDLPSRRAAVLIGGDSKHHRFTDAACAHVLDRLEQIRAQGAALMITVSRRTPPAMVEQVRARYADQADVWLHDGDGPNPYFAFLAAADWIIVTEDSTNMLTEAASTGTPVYRLGVDGDPGKFRQLYAGLEGAGAVRPYLGRLERWSYEPLDETDRAAQRVLEILRARRDIRAI